MWQDENHGKSTHMPGRIGHPAPEKTRISNAICTRIGGRKQVPHDPRRVRTFHRPRRHMAEHQFLGNRDEEKTEGQVEGLKHGMIQ